ncbi:hypothetical protein AeMF1_016073 [Aphanomyces euteiches]|nr:hypothetical protein AeMF1_016073 [Aphanomyces euteiches]KAH9188012.1 hypothetical protein AeNC1_010017 [Aphanomyces euteiches]
MRSKLPLPLNFFECPPLAPVEIDRLKLQAHTHAVHVLQRSLMQEDNTTKWSLLSKQGAFTIHKGIDTNAQSHQLRRVYVAKTEVAASHLDEAIDLFRDDTSSQAQDFARRFNHDILDQATLYTLLAPSTMFPHDKVTVTWHAEKSPWKTIMANRDACSLDGRFNFELNNKRVWVRASKTVNLRCCPDMRPALGLVRMKHLSAGYVLMDANDRPGYISVAYVVQCDFGGRVSDWTLDQIMKRKCRSLLDIDLFLRENRLADGPFIAVTKLVPQRTRRHCYCCLKSFGVFGTKTNCLKCGEVFCSACCDPWTVRVDGEMMCIDACTICSHEIARAPRRRSPPGYGRKSAPDISDQALLETITSPTRRTTLVCPNRRRSTSSCKPLWAWQEQPQGLSSTPETSLQEDDLLAQDDDSDRDSIGDDGYDNEPQDAAWSSLPRIEPRRNSITLKKNPAASFKSCPDQLGSSFGLTLYKSPLNLKYKI